MAQFDSSIIFRQNPYTGPTVEDIQGKQNMNALRNTLGEGYNIDDPKVVNAMMARDPDMGLKLMTNANSMRKSESDVATAEQERMTTQLDRYVPLALAVARDKNQPAWTELHGELTQTFPALGRSLPTDVNLAGPAVQSYVAARQELASKGSTTPFNYDAPVATDQGFMVIGPDGQPKQLINPATGKPFMPPPKAAGDGNPESFTGNIQFARIGGKMVYAQPSNRGGPLQWQEVPPEMEVLFNTRPVDTGTGTVSVSTLGGTPTGPVIPKDVQGEALQTQFGKDRAAQLAAAPAAVTSGTRFLAQLDALDADPNLERGTGLSSYFNFIPGTGGKAFQVKLNKAVGSAFLDAIKALQGTGAITDREGGAATASVSGLDAGLDAASFKKELKILRDMVAKGLETARANAAERDRVLGGGAGSAVPAPAPAGAGAPGAPALFSPEELAKLRGGQ